MSLYDRDYLYFDQNKKPKGATLPRVHILAKICLDYNV